jgi:hypothetical protein
MRGFLCLVRSSGATFDCLPGWRIAPPFPAVSRECSIVLSKHSLAELLRPFRHRGRLFPGLENLIACRNVE